MPDALADSLWLDELVAPGIAPDRALATVRLLAERAGASRVRAWLRPDRVALPFVTRPRKGAYPMIAPLGGRKLPGPVFLGSFEHF